MRGHGQGRYWYMRIHAARAGRYSQYSVAAQTKPGSSGTLQWYCNPFIQTLRSVVQLAWDHLHCTTPTNSSWEKDVLDRQPGCRDR